MGPGSNIERWELDIECWDLYLAVAQPYAKRNADFSPHQGDNLSGYTMVPGVWIPGA